MDFASWPHFEEDEIQSVVNVLRSGKINQWTGNEVTSFETEFAQYIGSRYAIALANGSLALDLALMALDIGKGDEVIVTSRSFVASVSCVVLRGAVPVFVDVNLESQNITFESISKAFGPKTKAVIVVHLAGWPCEIDKIRLFCKQKEIALIEDCAQAHGAKYKNERVGGFGDCSIFSFCQDKIITTGGEGGMLLTNREDIWEKVWSYKDHGKKYREVFSQKHELGFRWVVESFGTNCRMTEIQAAIGRIMLKKLDKWVEKRRFFADLLNSRLNSVKGLRVTTPPPDVYHSYYKYYIFLKSDDLKEGWSRRAIIETLNKQNIPCDTGICPEIYLEKAFESCLFRIDRDDGNFHSDIKNEKEVHRLPNAKKLGETSMAFLVHPTLDSQTIQYVIDKLQRVMEKACN